MTRAFVASTIVAAFLVACASEQADTLANGPGTEPGENGEIPGTGPGGGPGGEQTPGTTPGTGTTPPPPGACEALPHVGFANTDFVAERKPGEIGLNRRRVKPFTALSTEFRRVLGQVPTGLAPSAAAYGEAPARWYAEPTAGAVSLYTTYTLAFRTCYDTMTDAKFTVAPTATTAPAECSALQRKAWQRTPAPEETKACADLALGLTDEALARRRWAHACASVMTSTGFTTY